MCPSGGCLWTRRGVVWESSRRAGDPPAQDPHLFPFPISYAHGDSSSLCPRWRHTVGFWPLCVFTRAGLDLLLGQPGPPGCRPGLKRIWCPGPHQPP